MQCARRPRLCYIFIPHLAIALPHDAQFEQWIPLPLDQVFEFFGNLENLPRIMPSWMQVRLEKRCVVDPPAAPPGKIFCGIGSTLVASFRPLPFLPLRIRSEARIVEFALNSFFEDVQDAGPFRSWRHRHEFASETRAGVPGTLIRDRIQYEVGLGPFGRLINKWFIAPQLRQTFAFRQEAVERLLGTPSL